MDRLEFFPTRWDTNDGRFCITRLSNRQKYDLFDRTRLIGQYEGIADAWDKANAIQKGERRKAS